MNDNLNTLGGAMLPVQSPAMAKPPQMPVSSGPSGLCTLGGPLPAVHDAMIIPHSVAGGAPPMSGNGSDLNTLGGAMMPLNQPTAVKS